MSLARSRKRRRLRWSGRSLSPGLGALPRAHDRSPIRCTRYRCAIALDGTAPGTSDIDSELERVVPDFYRLLDSATLAELRKPTHGTKWTNRQLLFHMLFGFILVRVLVRLVKGFGRLPPATSQAFAAILNAASRPFHVINYLSALPGGTVLGGRAMGRLMERTIDQLRSSLARESEDTLDLAMHFPVGWDPYFKAVMTVADVYHYPTQHYAHHRRQLTTRRALSTSDRLPPTEA
jgi:hypothetical protein